MAPLNFFKIKSWICMFVKRHKCKRINVKRHSRSSVHTGWAGRRFTFSHPPPVRPSGVGGLPPVSRGSPWLLTGASSRGERKAFALQGQPRWHWEKNYSSPWMKVSPGWMHSPCLLGSPHIRTGAQGILKYSDAQATPRARANPLGVEHTQSGF